MINRRRLMKRIIIAGPLLIVFVRGMGMNFTSTGAYKFSERTGHYGPSEVVHIEDFDGGRYYLGKYDKWFSCHTINRSLFFFWRHGSQVHGMENDLSKPLSYSGGGSISGGSYTLFGIINDKDIAKIEVVLKNGDRLIQEEFHDDMFLIVWEGINDRDFNFGGIIAYDANDNIIFEEMR